MSLHNDNALVVALDTSTDMLACAASWIDGQTGEMKLVSGDHMCRRHANVELVNTVDGVLAQAGLDRSDVGCYVVGRGPGSFTGVRIGVCIANAMAYALKLPVIEVSSLRALADAIDTERPVCALIDARNGNGYAALYENGKELIAPKAVVVSELIAELPPNTVFTGDGARTYHDAIAAALPNAAFAAEEKHMLTADMLAKCADGKLERGETCQEARPLYLRPTQAERMYKAKEQQK